MPTWAGARFLITFRGGRETLHWLALSQAVQERNLLDFSSVSPWNCQLTHGN